MSTFRITLALSCLSFALVRSDPLIKLELESRSTLFEPEYDSPYYYEDTALEERGWSDINIGVMMERDIAAESGKMTRRSSIPRALGPFETRDVGRTRSILSIDERGEIKFPESYHDAVAQNITKRDTKKIKKTVKKVTKKKSKSKSKNKKAKKPKKSGPLIPGDLFSAVITWYTGHDLLNPSCLPDGGWAPTDTSLIAAVTANWDDKPACGSWLQLRPKGSSKSVVVRVVDTCGGCAPGVAHVDLSKAAFSALYKLDVGLVKGIQVKVLDKPPTQSFTSKIVSLYGPKILRP